MHFSIRFLVLLLLLLGGGVRSVRADISRPATGAAPLQVEGEKVRVLRGGEVAITLRAHYSGGAALRFAIVQPPAHGKLSGWGTLGGNRAGVTYKHDGSSEEQDGFSYVAQAGGRTSSPAEVRISVEEPAARLRVPAALDFGEILAGERSTRMLPVENAGGGILSGRLTVSDPWVLAPAEFRVAAGATETIQVAFRPSEAKAFVGQVTLTGANGEAATIALSGNATAPLRIAPSPVLLRTASVTLTNETDRALPLTFQTSPRLQQIAALELPARGVKDVQIIVRPEVTEAVHEVVTISGPRFTLPLPVDAPGTLVRKEIAPPVAEATATIAEATPAPVPPTVTEFLPIQASEAAATPTVESNTKVTAERLGPEHWALRWAADKPPPSSYRFEERELALDPRDELVVKWRQLPIAKVSPTTDPVSAELDHLPARQLHMIRVTALGADGATLWQAPLVSLPPEPRMASEHNFWLPLLCLFLAGFLFLRWRAGRVST